MSDRDEIFRELARLGEELGNIPVTICVTHKRFVPCRKGGEHVLSSKPEDIEMVRTCQSSLCYASWHGARAVDHHRGQAVA